MKFYKEEHFLPTSFSFGNLWKFLHMLNCTSKLYIRFTNDNPAVKHNVYDIFETTVGKVCLKLSLQLTWKDDRSLETFEILWWTIHGLKKLKLLAKFQEMQKGQENVVNKTKK